MAKIQFKKTPVALAIAAVSTMGMQQAAQACTPDGSSQTITVNATNDVVSIDAFTTLREAFNIANANPGCDVINFDLPSGSTITLDSAANGAVASPLFNESVNIQGPGSGELSITEVASSKSILNGFGSDISISGVTLSDGSEYGIWVYNTDNLVIDDVVIQNNDALGMDQSGGIRIQSGNDMNISISNSTITENASSGNGGGIYITSTGIDSLLIENTNITDNTAINDGAGIFIDAGNVTDDTASFIIRDTTISGNQNPNPSEGGGGSGLYLDAASSTTSDITIEDSVISNNTADNSGAGILITSSSSSTLNTEINKTTISGNTLTEVGSGGGFHYRLVGSSTATLNISDSSFVDNTIPTPSSPGAGLSISVVESSELSSAVITQSTFSGNTVNGNGGAIHVSTSASGSVSSMSVNHSTITNNNAIVGGGIYAGTGVFLNLDHSIIAGNIASTSDEDLFGNYLISYIFLGVDSANAAILDDGNSTLNGGAPDLTVLTSVGGMQVHVPNEDSPVIDAGNPALVAGTANTPSLDQRSRRRIDGDQIDLGAVEVQVSTSGGGNSGLGFLGLLASLLFLRRKK